MNTPKRIFLIENNPDHQEMFLRAIQKIDNLSLHNIATNGFDALYKLQHNPTLPDLIFLDTHMPFMNGIDCLKEILHDPRTKDIPVVVLSSDTAKAEQAKQLGARAFIKKPPDHYLLRLQIEQFIHLHFPTKPNLTPQISQLVSTA